MAKYDGNDLSSSQAKLPPSSHRLPTVSASDALLDLGSNGPFTLPSGLPSLDTLLTGCIVDTPSGFPRGKVSEVWGPNGAGKTGLMLQTAARCLLTGRHVVWLDAGTPLSGPRLQSTLDALADLKDSNRPDTMQGFKHTSLPTLTHLLAMTLQPHADFLSDKTSLMIIDEVNTLVDIDYPRVHQFTTSSRTEAQKWQASRRYAVLGSLVNGLSKFAALHDIAVIVSIGCSTRGRSTSGLPLALVPSIGGSEWEAAIHNKVVIFRDFDARFIGVQKAQGRSLTTREEVGESGRIIPFEVTQAGVLEEMILGSADAIPSMKQQILTAIIPSPKKGIKRPYDEIADSEGEDVDEYGWAEADEDVLATESLAGIDNAALETTVDTDLVT